ncbi:MAG: hypothetical protein HUU35_02040 [Armatimonadetes bacterium]|nr:hypothetical protein [Armatimonadota bacterium]
MDGPSRERVTPRAVLIGLLATSLLCGLTPYNDFKIAATYLAGNHLPLGSFVLLAILVLVVNVVLRALCPAKALRPGELLTIWAMLSVASGLPSSGLFRYLTPHIIAGHHFATPENGWAERILVHLPAALQIEDAQSIAWFYRGLHGQAPLPWLHWVRPLAVYGVFTMALFTAFLSLSVLLRRQWVEHERFTFPLAQLPVEMVGEPRTGQLLPPLFGHPALWAAVALVTIIHTLNGLHRLYAAVPQVGNYDWRIAGIAGRGWRTLNGTWLWVYPLVLGFSYLLNNEVLLSLWFFYLLYKLQLVGADWLGIQPEKVGAGYGTETFAAQQAVGAALALTAWMVYSGRHHFAAIVHRAVGGPPLPGEREEGLSYRVAFWLLALSLLVMLAWLLRFGGSLTMAVGTLVFAFASFLTLTWLVAQAGLLFVQPVWAGREVMVRLLGSGAFTPRSILVAAQVEHIFAMDLREFVLPHVMNIQRASDAYQTSRRGLLLAMGLALAVGFAVSAWATIRLPYEYGAEVGLNNAWTYQTSPQLVMKFVESLLNKPEPGRLSAWWNVGGGWVGMWLVMLLRTHAPWFRLHPAGFIIASGYPARAFWFSLLLGWLLKNAILRAGGLRLYRAARPLFLGLVIGDCLNGGLWVILSAWLRVQYRILPG